MKTLYIIPLIIFIQLLNANELEWVDEQIKAIQPPREGMKNIHALKDPFIFLKKNKDDEESKKNNKVTPSTTVPLMGQNITKEKVTIVKKSTFDLSMIINKSAKINNKWYKQGDILSDYEILTISPSSVVLVKNKKQTILSTNSKNKNSKLKH